jgi:hypothetical protein
VELRTFTRQSRSRSGLPRVMEPRARPSGASYAAFASRTTNKLSN